MRIIATATPRCAEPTASADSTRPFGAGEDRNDYEDPTPEVRAADQHRPFGAGEDRNAKPTITVYKAAAFGQHRPFGVGEDRDMGVPWRAEFGKPEQHRPSGVGEDRNTELLAKTGDTDKAAPAKAAPASQGR